MKFMFFFLPTLPATLEERRKLRPIANHTERWQKMISEVVEVAQMAEDLGFEGSASPSITCIAKARDRRTADALSARHSQHQAYQGGADRICPARMESATPGARNRWLDQLTKGRTFVGFARGYQTRWLNQMAQKIHVGATTSDKSETDRSTARPSKRSSASSNWRGATNRSVSRANITSIRRRRKELRGRRTNGRANTASGEVDEQGRIQKINVVPKPYQKPHPQLSRPFRSAKRPFAGAPAKGSSRPS